jgi:Ca-activated chloride channel family protein
MIQFEWVWMFLLLPLPFLVRRFLPALPRESEAALRVPFINDLESYSTSRRTSGGKIMLSLAALAWLTFIVALARPQWLGDPVQIPITGRDLMLAVDLSGSMQTEDFKLHGHVVDRLTAIKAIASDFIKRRKGDRIGLILFGSKAYLQTPLTFDRKTVDTLLNESVIGLAGQQTAIGDAIGLAVKRLMKQKDNSRVLILLTDGANDAGEVSPIKAAQLAAQYKLKIYTIGIGADEMLVRSFFGIRRINPSADLDEKTLTRIAKITGGRYFRARDTAQLKQIYHLLDKLEPVEKDKQTFRPVKALFFWPLAFAVILSGILVVLRLVRRGAF